MSKLALFIGWPQHLFSGLVFRGGYASRHTHAVRMTAAADRVARQSGLKSQSADEERCVPHGGLHSGSSSRNSGQPTPMLVQTRRSAAAIVSIAVRVGASALDPSYSGLAKMISANRSRAFLAASGA
jgi:hypothetical protein